MGDTPRTPRQIVHDVLTVILEKKDMPHTIMHDCSCITHTRPHAAQALLYEAVRHECWPVLLAFLGADLFVHSSTHRRLPVVKGPLGTIMELMKPCACVVARVVVAKQFECARRLLCAVGLTPGPVIPYEDVLDPRRILQSAREEKPWTVPLRYLCVRNLLMHTWGDLGGLVWGFLKTRAHWV